MSNQPLITYLITLIRGSLTRRFPNEKEQNLTLKSTVFLPCFSDYYQLFPVQKKKLKHKTVILLPDKRGYNKLIYV